MMRTIRAALPVLAVLTMTLGGCDRDRPPAPTAEESDGLNEADAMLNTMAANEEGPEAKAPDPSINAG